MAKNFPLSSRQNDADSVHFFFPTHQRIKLINLKMWVLRARGDYYMFFSGHGGTLNNQGGNGEHSKKFCYTIADEHLVPMKDNKRSNTELPHLINIILYQYLTKNAGSSFALPCNPWLALSFCSLYCQYAESY